MKNNKKGSKHMRPLIKYRNIDAFEKLRKKIDKAIGEDKAVSNTVGMIMALSIMIGIMLPAMTVMANDFITSLNGVSDRISSAIDDFAVSIEDNKNYTMHDPYVHWEPDNTAPPQLSIQSPYRQYYDETSGSFDLYMYSPETHKWEEVRSLQSDNSTILLNELIPE